MTERRGTWLLAGACAALVLFAWGDLRGLGPAGPDAWPLLLQAQETRAEPGRLLGERYLAGSWQGARFLRPGFVGLHALVPGDAARGDAALAAALAALWACALALGLACRTVRPGPGAFAAALLACALAIVHPLHVDTLPALARRADLFAGTFIAITVAAMLHARGSRSARGFGLAACAAALAPLFKETGLVAAPLGLLALALPGAHARGGRVRLLSGALLFGLPFAGHLAWRLAVLGTVGRYDVAVREIPFGRRVASLAEGLVAHEGVVIAGVLATACLALASALAWRRAAREDRGDETAALILAAAWLVATAIALSASERCRMRHAVALLPPAALLAGLLALRIEAIPRGTLRQLGRAALLLGLAAAVVPGSPLVNGPGAWTTSADVSARIVEAARTVVAPAGSSSVSVGEFRVRATRHEPGAPEIEISPFPYRVAPPPLVDGPRIDAPMILMPYSVDAAVRAGGAGVVRTRPGGALWAVTPTMLGPP